MSVMPSVVFILKGCWPVQNVSPFHEAGIPSGCNSPLSNLFRGCRFAQPPG